MKFSFDFRCEKQCSELLDECGDILSKSAKKLYEIADEFQYILRKQCALLDSLKEISYKLHEESRESIVLQEALVSISKLYRDMDNINLWCCKDINDYNKTCIDVIVDRSEDLLNIYSIIKCMDLTADVADILLDYFLNNIPDEEMLEIFDYLESSPSDIALFVQYIQNIKEWKENKEKYINENGYIYDQSLLNEMQYGNTLDIIEENIFGEEGMNASENTCGVIATYNAMISMGWVPDEKDFPKMLLSFSKNGMMLNGMFGTNPNAIAEYLTQQGYSTDMLVGSEINEDTLNTLQNDYDTYIVTYYNDANDITAGMHTVNVVNNNGKFCIINGGDGDEYDSLEDLFNNYTDGNGRETLSVIGAK